MDFREGVIIAEEVPEGYAETEERRAAIGNALIKTLWANLPPAKDKENVVDAVKINALELLPRDKGYYTFAGSLTSPPCSEDVKWFVLKTPTQISADEIARFGKAYPMNSRPVQELNARDIQATR